MMFLTFINKSLDIYRLCYLPIFKFVSHMMKIIPAIIKLTKIIFKICYKSAITITKTFFHRKNARHTSHMNGGRSAIKTLNVPFFLEKMRVLFNRIHNLCRNESVYKRCGGYLSLFIFIF